MRPMLRLGLLIARNASVNLIITSSPMSLVSCDHHPPPMAGRIIANTIAKTMSSCHAEWYHLVADLVPPPHESKHVVDESSSRAWLGACSIVSANRRTGSKT